MEVTCMKEYELAQNNSLKEMREAVHVRLGMEFGFFERDRLPRIDTYKQYITLICILHDTVAG